MEKSLTLGTSRKGLVLRVLTTEADDIAYFDAIEASRDHLSQFGDETADKYPDISSVTEARTNPSNPNKLRFGIWNDDTFVGSINLTPSEDNTAEIGYWLDVRQTGRGYATLAINALAQHARPRYSNVYANVTKGNEASVHVLERAGFTQMAKEAGRFVFALSGITKPRAEISKSAQDLERFADHPNRREALRAKDKDNLTVFLSYAVAKKLYRCPCCRGGINIGDSHAILSRVQMSKRYTHHHIDLTCIQDKVLPALKEIRIVKPQEASASAVNARGRRYRNKKRRN